MQGGLVGAGSFRSFPVQPDSAMSTSKWTPWQCFRTDGLDLPTSSTITSVCGAKAGVSLPQRSPLEYYQIRFTLREVLCPTNGAHDPLQLAYTTKRHVFNSSFFSIPFMSSPFFSLVSLRVVTQFRGNTAGSSPPSSIRFVLYVFLSRQDFSPFFPRRLESPGTWTPLVTVIRYTAIFFCTI